ncbi:unnamed protein product [Brassicogethes aeneus]|uniref:FP protein C-terminal domain-containing protein n=1 Tax=Brassicogethes aeneus TaxID=1431903 RepID=A0A9P0AY63_BRAAE|nr:unnamed protein product [Brassicogethes aeneus]
MTDIKLGVRNEIQADNKMKYNIVKQGLKYESDNKSRSQIKDIFLKIKMDISENQYTCKLLPSKNPRKPVLVTLQTEDIKNEVLDKKKEYGKLETHDNETEGEKTNIYPNEDLPHDIRYLLKNAKSLREKKNYKHVWIKNGLVLERRIHSNKNQEH